MTKFNTTNNNNNQKEQHFFSLALRSLLCMWFVDCSLLVWRSFLKKGTPLDLFLPHTGSTHGRIWPKRQTHAREFAMSSLSLPSRDEMIYRWYCSTEASIRVMVGGGLESIRICLSEIFWLNLHCIRFCPICFYSHVWCGNRSTYKLNHLEYFVHFRPLPKKLTETSWGDVCASDNNNFTTIRYFFSRISSDIYNTVFRVWHGAVLLKPN